MTEFFHTLNSAYELDMPSLKIRRLSGRFDPTPRQGSDGEWKQFQAISVRTAGQPVLIVWETVEGVGRSTLTSVVVPAN